MKFIYQQLETHSSYTGCTYTPRFLPVLVYHPYIVKFILVSNSPTPLKPVYFSSLISTITCETLLSVL